MYLYIYFILLNFYSFILNKKLPQLETCNLEGKQDADMALGGNEFDNPVLKAKTEAFRNPASR